MSCALTLARKFKLNSLSKIFAKFGKDLGAQIDNEKKIALVDISYQSAVNISKIVEINQEPLKGIETV